MIIYGHDITLSDATVLLALFTATAAVFTALAANYTKKLSQYNKNLIEQGEKQHRERLKPMCVPLTNSQLIISNFDEVLTTRKNIPVSGAGISDDAAVVWVNIKNQGLGPALNVRFHINDIENRRMTKDFLASYLLPPGESSKVLLEIPCEEFRDAMGAHVMGIEPHDVINNAYHIVCEYESIFFGEQFYSIVSKGYLDPSLAGDGKNKLRLQRPRNPPVVFKDGLDPATPLWPVPPDDDQYPGEFLNRANTGGGNQTL